MKSCRNTANEKKFCYNNYKTSNTFKEDEQMGFITIKIPDNLDKELEEFLNKNRIPRDKFLQEAIETYIKVKKFRKLREETVKYAESQGFFDDEDIFKTIS